MPRSALELIVLQDSQLADFMDAERSPCLDAIPAIEEFMKQPYTKLEYKDAPDKMCAARPEDERLGDCIARIPKIGIVAGCLNEIKKVRRK